MAEPVVVSASIAADPLSAYSLISDVARMGNFSPEATGARGADRELKVGDRFVGLNRRGPVVWFTICTVTVAEPGIAFEFLVDMGPFPVSRWRYDIVPQADGIEVRETWWDRRNGPLGQSLKLMGQAVIPGSRPDHNRRNMQITLDRMKATLEAQA